MVGDRPTVARVGGSALESREAMPGLRARGMVANPHSIFDKAQAMGALRRPLR
jgi:hypothetical protein